MARYKLILKQAILTELEDSQIEATVILNTQDKTYTGTKKGVDSPDNRIRVVVEATLAALEQSTPKPVKFEISDITIKEFGGQSHKFLVVLLKTDYFIQPVGEAIELLGACQLSENGVDAETAARATLDATNRTVSSMLGGR
ncbi:MAG: hypothetical protein WAQ98_01830 [Blastocatellia bacterium]